MDDLVKLNIADDDFLRDLVNDHQHHHHHRGRHDGRNNDKVGDDDSSDPETEKYYVHYMTCENRLFGRQRPLHCVLGGGLWADVILWRNSETSASLLGGVTITWLLFEYIGFSFVTLSCNVLLFMLISLFLWSNLAYFSNLVSPPKAPIFTLREGLFLKAALWLRHKYHRARGILEAVVFGRDLKLFVKVIGALSLIAALGNWFRLLSLVYLMTVMLLTVPMVYESYEDNVDTFAEKIQIGMRRQYTLFVEKILPKLLDAVS